MVMRMPRLLGNALFGSVLATMCGCGGQPAQHTSEFPPTVDAAVEATDNDGAGQTGVGDSTPQGETSMPPLFGNDAALDDSPVGACDSSACGDGAGDGSAGYCGDGQIEPGKQCDDGNMASNDGCSATCQLEAGYSCPTPGQPCVKIWICGNGKIDPGET